MRAHLGRGARVPLDPLVDGRVGDLELCVGRNPPRELLPERAGRGHPPLVGAQRSEPLP